MMPPMGPRKKSPLKNKVKLGAKKLDTYYPGWYRQINTGRLDMGNVCKCILGQLYTHYLTGLKMVNLISAKHPRKALNLGFRGANENENIELKKYWIEEIKKRRKDEYVPRGGYKVSRDGDDKDSNQ